jgi:beta-lactamase regulating signal transducer with metallopeptidase domain
MHISAMFNELAVTAPAAWAWLASQWQSFATSAGSSLVTSIWQSATIVCALEIAIRLMPRISAAHRFATWAAAFALALAMPFLPLVHFGGNAVSAATSDPAIGPTSSHALLQLDTRWAFAIAALWVIASLIRAAGLAVHSIRLRRLWKAAQPVQISDSLSASLDTLHVRRTSICTTRLLDRPSVIGFLSPRILIPEWLFARLTPRELEQIVLHEAEHLRRRDDWTNLLQKLSLVIFPLNPALIWIERRLCREREMACDEGVIRITNAPRAYAACLTSLAERGLERRAEALSLGAWHRRSELVHRVHRILLHKHTMSRTAAGALLTALGSMLVAGSVEMARVPQLVAFVPKHNTQAMRPARQIDQGQLDALLARENAEAKITLAPSYRAVPAKAILPHPHPSASANRNRVALKHDTPASTVAAVPPQPDQQIARTELSGDRVVSPEPQPQQWVVVAAWERVSTFSRAPQAISDYEPGSSGIAAQNSTSSTTASNSTSGSTTNAPAQPAPPNTSQNQNRPAHQYTVTQLILRVVPANPNSSSTQPATVPLRDGWFVIQL